MESTTTDRLELFRLAYGDCNDAEARLLHFRIQTSDQDEAEQFIRLIGQYNAFEPEAVATYLGEILPELSSVEIGREYSPVIYAIVPHWTHQTIGSDEEWGERISDEDRKAIALRFVQRMRACEADELSAGDVNEPQTLADIPDDVYQLRAWWD